MKTHRDESSVEDTWSAFVRADVHVHAPPDLEARVLNAVRTSRPIDRSYRRTRVIRAAALAAAMLLTTMVLTRYESGDVPPPSEAAVARGGSQTPTESAAPAPVPRPPVGPARGAARRVRPARAPSPREPLSPVLMTLGASPVRDTEVLQLVRLRLPREALQGLGVVLLEPDAAGIVDVDVLIGEDGLARDIRQVRTGGERQEMPH